MSMISRTLWGHTPRRHAPRRHPRPTRALVLALSAALTGSLLLVAPASAMIQTTLYVAHAGADETNTAAECSFPDFTTAALTDSAAIQAAVTAAASDSAITTIHICGDAQWSLTATIHVGKDASYSLAFEGDGRTGPTATVIDGADTVMLFTADSCGTSCGGTYTAASLSFSALKLQNGLGNYEYVDGGTLVTPAVLHGGAIAAATGTVHLTNVAVESNSAQWGGAVLASVVDVHDSTFDTNTVTVAGGAIYAMVHATVADSTFTGNTSDLEGGAIESPLVTVSGSAFRHNHAIVGAAGYSDGGAIYSGNYGGAASTITNTEFTENSGHYGGAVEASGPLSITGGTFTSNSGGCGGAVMRSPGASGTFTITDATFTTNQAAYGGAVCEGGALVTLAGTTAFSGNSATTAGGAVWSAHDVAAGPADFDANTSQADGGAVYGASVTADGATFTDNIAGPGASAHGGAIYATASVSVTASLLTGNTAGSGGAVYAANTAPITVTTSTLADNHADAGAGLGGALWGHGTVEITRSTANDNTAASGGAAYAFGTMTATNSTFAANHASSGGGALLADSGTLRNVTFLGNSGGYLGASGAFYAGLGSVQAWQVDDTIFGDASDTCAFNAGASLGGTGNLTAAPSPCPGTSTTGAALKLGVLADNGGPTKTIALLAGSVAIDAVAPVALACGTAIDQRGISRPQKAACDAGAYEADGDLTPPSAPGTPAVTLRAGASLAGSAIPVRVTWTASTDDVGGSGLAASPYTLQRREGAGAWTDVGAVAGPTADTTVAAGKATAFRVVARDAAGNATTGAESAARTYALTQQASTAVKWGGTWTKQASALFSGGSAKYAKAAGRWASYTFTGRAVAFVTTRAAVRGKVTIYIDGVKKKVLDTKGATAYQVLAWTWSGTAKSHTIKIVVAGTAGRPRVDLDAFVIVK